MSMLVCLGCIFTLENAFALIFKNFYAPEFIEFFTICYRGKAGGVESRVDRRRSDPWHTTSSAPASYLASFR